MAMGDHEVACRIDDDQPGAQMKTGFVLAAAIALAAIHDLTAAAVPDKTAAATQVKTPAKTSAKNQTKKQTKKPAKKTRVAARKKKLETPPPKENSAAAAASMELYKKQLAQRISDSNTDKIYAEQPQALLRSVVVVRFVVDRHGKLVSSVIQRSNRDPETEAAALASLRSAAPFPKPPAKLLTNGRLEILETWLFNRDGRFQVRSIAQAQKSE
jgi:protein TonB